MHDHLRNHASKKVFNESQSEAECSPVMAHFQDFQAIALELSLAVEILLLERL